MNAHRTVEGGCHCGNVTVRVELTADPTGYEPRACDCDFCRMHGAAYVSDPGGRLTLRVADADRLARYRQGAEEADMLHCANCGVLIGACYEDGQERFGVVNARILAAELEPAVDASPKRLGPDEKVQRWQEIWFGDVRFE